jgi:hypothetical protein
MPLVPFLFAHGFSAQSPTNAVCVALSGKLPCALFADFRTALIRRLFSQKSHAIVTRMQHFLGIEQLHKDVIPANVEHIRPTGPQWATAALRPATRLWEFIRHSSRSKRVPRFQIHHDIGQLLHCHPACEFQHARMIARGVLRRVKRRMVSGINYGGHHMPIAGLL